MPSGCYKHKRRKIEPDIDRDALVNLLKSNNGSVRQVARILGRDKDTVGKWIKIYNIMNEDQMAAETIRLLKTALPKLKPLKVRELSGKDLEEVIGVQLSDWHLGTKTYDSTGGVVYNSDIAKTRAESVCSNILDVVFNHAGKGSKFTNILILITGDMVDGEEIYPTQAYGEEYAPPEQVIKALEVITRFILALKKLNLPISIKAVMGNHGRTSKTANPKSNWDLMLYMILEFWIREKQVKDIDIKYSMNDYLNFTVFDKIIQIRHQAPPQVETASGKAKAGGWARLHGVSAVFFGHLHHFSFSEWINLVMIMCGSLKGGDDLSEKMAVGGEPSQVIFGISRKRLPTFVYRADMLD